MEGKGKGQEQGRGGRREAKRPPRRAERHVLRSVTAWPCAKPWVALHLVSRQALLTNYVTEGNNDDLIISLERCFHQQGQKERLHP